MKKFCKISFIAALTVSMALPLGARTIRDFFLSESGDVLKALPTSKRADMLAYYDVDRLMPTETNFGESATLEKVTADYISLTTSSSSDVQMKMLTSGRDTMLLVVNTVKMPARDSRVRLFDKNWREMNPSKAIKLAKMEDFVTIPKGSKLKKEDILGRIRFPIISYTIDSVSCRVTAHQELKDFMSKDEYAKIGPYLKEMVIVKK